MLCAHPVVTPLAEDLATHPAALPPAADILVHGAPRFVATLCGPDAVERAELEQFIRDVFRRAHGATIRHFLPQLMSLRGSDGKLLAVCGLRNASSGRLFLETYLDAPVETLIAQRAAQDVDREEIVEIGNLAVAEPGIAPHLLASVSHYLHGSGTQWAVFTAIPVLRNSLTRLNMQLEVLGDARIDRILPEERPGWGRYYDQKPQVMAVRRASRPDFMAI
jgi:hypothetical protein